MTNSDINKANIVILTGAGISAESGLQTFRASDGLWNNYRVDEVATPEAFALDPELVNSFYNVRRQELQTVAPNAAHIALAELEQKWSGEFLLVTQNVDNLHERAGSKNLIHMHGSLKEVKCINTDQVFDWEGDINDESKCMCCNDFGTLRPNIVWFGEIPYEMEKIERHLDSADIFVSIGTSGNVYPAAAFVDIAKENNCTFSVESNLAQTSDSFDSGYYGPATEQVPILLNDLFNQINCANDNM